MSISIQTRNEAYLAIVDDLSDKQKLIYQTIRYLGKASNSDISEYLKIPINQVTGRVTELRKQFLIQAIKTKANTYTGIQNAVWKTVEDHYERIQLMIRFIEESSHYLRLIEDDLRKIDGSYFGRLKAEINDVLPNDETLRAKVYHVIKSVDWESSSKTQEILTKEANKLKSQIRKTRELCELLLKS